MQAWEHLDTYTSYRAHIAADLRTITKRCKKEISRRRSTFKTLQNSTDDDYIVFELVLKQSIADLSYKNIGSIACVCIGSERLVRETAENRLQYIYECIKTPHCVNNATKTDFLTSFIVDNRASIHWNKAGTSGCIVCCDELAHKKRSPIICRFQLTPNTKCFPVTTYIKKIGNRQQELDHRTNNLTGVSLFTPTSKEGKADDGYVAFKPLYHEGDLLVFGCTITDKKPSPVSAHRITSDGSIQEYPCLIDWHDNEEAQPIIFNEKLLYFSNALLTTWLLTSSEITVTDTHVVLRNCSIEKSTLDMLAKKLENSH
jgi:hypothetical protein